MPFHNFDFWHLPGCDGCSFCGLRLINTFMEWQTWCTNIGRVVPTALINTTFLFIGKPIRMIPSISICCCVCNYAQTERDNCWHFQLSSFMATPKCLLIKQSNSWRFGNETELFQNISKFFKDNSRLCTKKKWNINERHPEKGVHKVQEFNEKIRTHKCMDKTWTRRRVPPKLL